ncbi:MAG: DNA polymerase III subunit delta' [Rhodanobacteraceae bacterium]
MNPAPWLDAPWRRLSAALDADRLPHALLITGADGLGKRTLANALINAALCESRSADGRACGRCRSCKLLAAGTHPDRMLVTFELRDDGKPRVELTVEQIRRLAQRLALASQFGGLQLALIDPADAMNANAANALLKTLEEPNPGTRIVLVSERPSRLPATIRSRCQREELGVPARESAQSWLERQHVDATLATRALDASLGNPGLALAWARDGIVGLRADCARDLDDLAAGRVNPSALAETWAGDRVHERLWFSGVLARDAARRVASGQGALPNLTAGMQMSKLSIWFDQANRIRSLLDTPLRTELLLFDLLRSWPLSTRGGERDRQWPANRA